MLFIIIIVIIVVAFIAISVFSSIQADKEEEKKFITISTKDKETLLFELTGVHVHKSYIINFCKESHPVTLEFEPDNIYDENAIMVLHDGKKIGYVPSFETDEVKEFILKYDYYALIYKKELNMGYLYMEIGLVEK